jgi:very-short-patch-repair endonuclease
VDHSPCGTLGSWGVDFWHLRSRSWQRSGRFLGRPDLYYPEHRLGLEYDGGVHRESLAEDNRRQNRLLEEGIRLLRFTAGDLPHPTVVVAQVRAVLETPE